MFKLFSIYIYALSILYENAKVLETGKSRWKNPWSHLFKIYIISNEEILKKLKICFLVTIYAVICLASLKFFNHTIICFLKQIKYATPEEDVALSGSTQKIYLVCSAKLYWRCLLIVLIAITKYHNIVNHIYNLYNHNNHI